MRLPVSRSLVCATSLFSYLPPYPLIAAQHALNEVAEGTPEVLAGSEVVLVDEEDVLLEGSVEVGLEAELADDGVVVAVDVGVDAVHALEDLAGEGGEGLGEGHADARGQDRLVVDAGLDPRHQLLDVGGRRHLGRALEPVAVLPQVLELVRRLHLRARLRRAELRDGAVQEIHLVVEVHHVHRQPLVLVLALRQLDHLSQAAAAQRRLRVLS